MPVTHSNPKNAVVEMMLQKIRRIKDRQKTGIRNTIRTGKNFSTSIPAIKGNRNLRKGAIFQELFCCPFFSDMEKSFYSGEAKKILVIPGSYFTLISGSLSVVLTVFFTVETRFLKPNFNGRD
jgi:hypothetical protein